MGKKILVIDYDQKSTARISELLTSRGFEIMTAADGQAGWDRFEQDSPDLIIMEPMLAKIHGFELCQKIRNASQGRTPVIILTGIYKDSIYKTEAVKIYGAFSYFEKPVEDGKLLAEIARAIGEDSPEDQAPAGAASPAKSAGHRAVKGEDEIESLLGQALAQAPEPDRRSAAGSESREVDDLLKKALKGFDLEAGKARPAVKHDKPAAPPVRREAGVGAISGPEPARPMAPERPAIEDELIRTVRESSGVPAGSGPRPMAKSEAREDLREAVKPREIPKEQPQERPQPILPVIEPAAREREFVPGDTLFGDMSGRPEKKKINIKLAAGITGAVVLLVVGLMIFKPASSSEKPAPVEGPAAITENAPVPAPEPASSGPEKSAVREPRREAKPSPKAAKPDRKNDPQPISESGKIVRDINVPAITPAAADKNVQAPAGNKTAAADAAVKETPSPAPVPSEPSTPAGNGAAEGPGNPPAEAAGDAQNAGAQPQTQAAQTPEPPAVVPGQLVELSQVVRQPEAIKKVSPVYPEIARKFGTAGTVTVNALINEFGVVTDTRILKGLKNDHGLHRAAEDAVKRWKFNPGYIGQVPVKVWLPVTIVFSAGEMR